MHVSNEKVNGKLRLLSSKFIVEFYQISIHTQQLSLRAVEFCATFRLLVSK